MEILIVFGVLFAALLITNGIPMFIKYLANQEKLSNTDILLPKPEVPYGTVRAAPYKTKYILEVYKEQFECYHIAGSWSWMSYAELGIKPPSKGLLMQWAEFTTVEAATKAFNKYKKHKEAKSKMKAVIIGLYNTTDKPVNILNLSYKFEY